MYGILEEGMPITMILRKQEFIIERETTVQQALKQIGVSPESHFYCGMVNCLLKTNACEMEMWSE